MTKTTEHDVKSRIYRETREKAVSCLVAMGADADGHDPHAWEGIMTLLSSVIRHGNADEVSAAVLAAAKWMWGHLECEAMNEVARVEELLEREMEAHSSNDTESSGEVSETKGSAATAA